MSLRYFLPLAGGILLSATAYAQIGFTNASGLLSNTTNSGNCIGVVDMDGDGLDDLAKLHLGRWFQVDHQNADGTFSLVEYGQVSNESQWGWAIGDVSNTGYKDMICGGSYDGVHYMRIDGPGNSMLSDLDNDDMFMQCNNMADINNDGALDFFACHDDAAPRQWINDGDGDLSYANIINYNTTPPSDMSGNYGSVWTDFDNDGDLDLYIAKCRQGVNNPEDPRRWNRLFVNDGNGNYTDMAAAYGLQIKNQSWTADFADIDNDGDMDLLVTNHDQPVQLFENDGTGQFTELVAVNSGIDVTGFFLQSKFADFDNDGYVDLLLSGGIERFYRNNGNQTFTQITGLFPSPKAMHGFATGDLNNDGFVDVFANYGTNYNTPDNNNPDRLWLNNGNDNHWLTVRLQGTESNRDAVGARVTIIGPWGTQIREVRSGESYGIVTTFACMFGLGQHTTIPTLIVNWPSGLEETFTDVAVDQAITIIEGTCIAPMAQITFPNALALCSGGGGSLDLMAEEGYTYQWSTGAQSQGITVSAPGYYSVTIADGEGCNATASVFVQQDPDETPVIMASGGTQLCEGDVLELSIDSPHPALWSNGQSGNTIAVTAEGTYSVTVQGTCAPFTSAPLEVDVYPAPEMPLATDATILSGEQATLMATGENVIWYDQQTGGAVVGIGNEFTTPPLFATTSYWAAAVLENAGDVVYGAREDKTNIGGYHNNGNFYLLFEAYEPMSIISVKVYAHGAGTRQIGVVSQGDGSIVASGGFMIPDGESRVDLNFEVPAGAYGLRILEGNPQLWRDSQGSGQTYPYALGDLGMVTSSTATGALATQLYYFFYDWEVAPASVICESERAEALVTIGNVGMPEVAAGMDLKVWPVPANSLVNIALDGVEGSVNVEVLDLAGRMVRQQNMIAGQVPVMLDLSGIESGEYLLKVTYEDGMAVRNMIIAH